MKDFLPWALPAALAYVLARGFEAMGDAVQPGEAATRLAFHLIALGLIIISLIGWIKAFRRLFGWKQAPQSEKSGDTESPYHYEFDPDAAIERHLQRRQQEQAEASPLSSKAPRTGFGRRKF
ncbi:hypothetical protein B2G71_02970 [Novosphingobium sp. PC22D]|uniref:hypothetical protein n=1 Tax=Novosphingobium sp. PC22D TaxID=1962403 RepID=UPI000BEF841B|nr:hypothetical protein [Novosphingobium sp. PC22D]PEQ14554.1 hypothetical protein B2G71_02970 [Novosphingobium sp. PC22D]